MEDQAGHATEGDSCDTRALLNPEVKVTSRVSEEGGRREGGVVGTIRVGRKKVGLSLYWSLSSATESE